MTDDWHAVGDHFAPGDFEELSDTEKLSRDSFEEMHAGVRVGADSGTRKHSASSSVGPVRCASSVSAP